MYEVTLQVLEVGDEVQSISDSHGKFPVGAIGKVHMICDYDDKYCYIKYDNHIHVVFKSNVKYIKPVLTEPIQLSLGAELLNELKGA